MGVGAGLYMCDVVKKSSRSLSHLLMSSCMNGRPKIPHTALRHRSRITFRPTEWMVPPRARKKLNCSGCLILIHLAVWPRQIGLKLRGLLCSFFFWGGGWVRIQHNVASAEAYFRTSGSLIHPAIWPKYIGRKLGWGCCRPTLFWGSWVPI